MCIRDSALGYAVGQPQFVFEVEDDSNDDFVADGGYAMELWYSFQVTDNIQITPAVYWLSRPLGDDTRDSDGDYTSFGCAGWPDSDHLQVLIAWPNFGWAPRTTFLTHTCPSPPLWRAFLWPI